MGIPLLHLFPLNYMKVQNLSLPLSEEKCCIKVIFNKDLSALNISEHELFCEKLRYVITGKLKIVRKNSVALVRERTIPTERPPPVSEVSANFCG